MIKWTGAAKTDCQKFVPIRSCFEIEIGIGIEPTTADTDSDFDGGVNSVMKEPVESEHIYDNTCKSCETSFSTG
jgi:hypothetical protein